MNEIWDNMTWIDATVGGIVLLSVLLGLARGLFASVSKLAVVAGAALIAHAYGDAPLGLVRSVLDNSPLAPFAAGALTFVAALFALGLGARALRAAFESLELGGWDRAGGFVYGLARGGIFALAFVLGGSALAMHKTDAWQQSRTVPVLGAALNAALPADSPPRQWLQFDSRLRPLVAQAEAVVAAAQTEQNAALEGAVKDAIESGGADVSGLLEAIDHEEIQGQLRKIKRLRDEDQAVLEAALEEHRNISNSHGVHHEAQVENARLHAEREEAELRAKGWGGWAAMQDRAFCELGLTGGGACERAEQDGETAQ